MINILNLGIGNFNSVNNWVKQSGKPTKLISDPMSYKSGLIIIPGVCSSATLIDRINSKNFNQLIGDVIGSGEIVLGICAGYQILGRHTEEGGGRECLGYLPFDVMRVKDNKNSDSGCTGWKEVCIKLESENELVKRFQRNNFLRGDAYFNHEFGALVETDAITTTDMYDKQEKYCSYFVRDNIIGFQFHPEKSSNFGLKLLGMFV